MKRFNKFMMLVACAATIGFASCSKDEGEDTGFVAPTGSSTVPTVTLTDAQSAFMQCYVVDVILARYTELSTAGKTLLTAVEAIAASTDSDKTDLIATAAEAWEAARISWERTEAYLFGPVDMAGIDPGIDSWPLVLPELQTSIQSWDSSTDSYKSLKTDGGDLKGFHAIEYMLFMNGNAKEVSIANFDDAYELEQGSLTDAEFEANLESYSVAVCAELYRCVLQLEAEWDYASMSSSKVADLEAYGSDITLLFTNGDYGNIFMNPSIDNAYYSSFNVCLQEAFIGLTGIADEVANVKIADPIAAETDEEGTGLLEVESWFSHNSISDFTNNMRGVKEAYMGVKCGDGDSAEATFDALTEPAANSLAARVSAADSAKGSEAITLLNTAIEAVKSMEAPFRDNLLDPSATAAQDAVNAALAALEDAATVIDVEIPEDEEE